MKDMVQVRRGGVQSYKGPDAKIGRSQFSRSHGLKMSFDADYLLPILVDDVMPGDTFTCKLNGFCRIFSPLDSPVMDNISLQTFFFFVPSRILWTRWTDMQGEHSGAGAQDTDYTVPIINDIVVNHAGVTTGHGLAAYMGLPEALDSSTINVNSLPFRAYNRIYSEWFRDQNLTNVIQLDVGDGPDAVANYPIRQPSKVHDYFTSCLPYVQKGTAETVALKGLVGVWNDGAITDEVAHWNTATSAFQRLDADAALVNISTTTGSAAERYYINLAGTGTDASTAALDINALRTSVAIQRLLERDARGGTRYVESIKAHFGVTSPDFRLQRPEYLGGGKAFINVSPVANTSATATQDQGELAGVGTGVIQGHGWAKSFTEHGYIIGIICARADLTYFQGLDKLWSRSTRYDFFIPALANLGEQSVLNKEIFVSNSAGTDDAVFGYQERWAEYRMKLSRVVALFNPEVSGNLAHWHLAEEFSSLPSLNTAFMNSSTPMDRVTTVDTAQNFLLDLWFDLKCARPMPVRSIPSLMSRF